MKQRTKKDIIEKAVPVLYNNQVKINKNAVWLPVSTEVCEKVRELLSRTEDSRLWIVAVNHNQELGLFITSVDLKKLIDNP